MADAIDRTAADAEKVFSFKLPLSPSTSRCGFTVSDPPPETFDDAVTRLAAMPPPDYDRTRKGEARRLGVRVGTLEDAVRKARGVDPSAERALQGRRLELKAPEPWPEHVNGTELLEALADYFTHHLVLPKGGADLLAAWALHTHCFDIFRHTPRLAIRSPEKGCGKTTVLDLLEHVVQRPLPAANVTAAAVFRAVEHAQPTLLIDEADTFLANSDDLRGVLNAGHKRGGQVVRCVGDDAEPRAFAVFAPAAIAAIGKLPGTIQDRSITLMMRRAKHSELSSPITADTERVGAELARKSARWLADNASALHDVAPTVPVGIANRSADNWRPLLAIATVVDKGWPQRLAEIANANADDTEDTGLLNALLVDVRTIFSEFAEDQLPTEEIVKALTAMDDRPWPELTNGKPITPSRFTRMVKPVGAVRRQWRDDTGRQVWGYRLDDFADAFDRYCPSPAGKSGDTGDIVENAKDFGDPKVVTPDPRHQFENGANRGISSVVTTSPLFPEGIGEGDFPAPSSDGWLVPPDADLVDMTV